MLRLRLTLIFLMVSHSCFGSTPEQIRVKAEQGNAIAQFYLGVMYDNGAGAAEDDAEALKWYRKAAEQGVAKALYSLGAMYLKGLGVSEDYTEAAKWYRKAAEQGHASSQYNLGVMYYNGEGVLEDDIYAYMWLNIAAAQGHKDAKNNKSLISKRMNKEQIAGSQKLSHEWLASRQD